MRSIKSKISSLKSSAKKRGYTVRLMEYEYESLLNVGCHYCGKEVLSENGYCLDRVDSSKGYTLHNVVACCKICNFAKGSMKFDEFISWVERAYKHQKKMIEFVRENYQEYNYKTEKDLHKKSINNENCRFIK